MAIGSKKIAIVKTPVAPVAAPAPARRGRPPGSKNKAASAPAVTPKKAGRPAKKGKKKLVSNFTFTDDMLSFEIPTESGIPAFAVLNYTAVPGRDGKPDREVVQWTRIIEKDGVFIATGLCPVPAEIFTGKDGPANVKKVCKWFQSFVTGQ